MGLFDLFKSKKQSDLQGSSLPVVRNSPDSYADSSSIDPDEREYYQDDDYYTYYSYPGTDNAVRVITFEERKKNSYASARGLYVAEIMLLEYCNYNSYPKPGSGYPGFWWFKYGIRDVGHALQSLEERGFLQWASKANSLNSLKVEQLKKILSDAKLSTTGKKTELIARIVSDIPEDELIIPDYIPKYELTELGKIELEENGYVPYMHNHRHGTTENNMFGETFNVWDINKLFPDGNAKNWHEIVGKIEEERFGVDMADFLIDYQATKNQKIDYLAKRDEIRNYLNNKRDEIKKGIRTKGDGFEEESQGIDYKSIGKDKEALVKFYISIGKKFDAPALYNEAATILRKYGMYEEELAVIRAGLKYIPDNNWHKKELFEREQKVLELISKKE